MEQGFGWLAYGLGVVSGLALAYLLRWQFRPKRPHLVQVPTAPVAIPPKLQAQIRMLKAQGQEIEAVKIVRKATGCDLKAARDAVLALR